MNFPINKKSGFTLLEFLIYIGIVSVISLIIGGTFLLLNNGRAINDSRAEVNSSINIVMSRLKDDIKNASRVIAPHAGQSASSLEVVVNGVNIVYALDASGIVTRKFGTVAAAPLTSGNVTFDSDPTIFYFKHVQNTNTALSQSLISIKVSMAASYDTESLGLEYTETSDATFSLGVLRDIERPENTLVGGDAHNAGKNIPKSP